MTHREDIFIGGWLLTSLFVPVVCMLVALVCCLIKTREWLILFYMSFLLWGLFVMAVMFSECGLSQLWEYYTS